MKETVHLSNIVHALTSRFNGLVDRRGWLGKLLLIVLSIAFFVAMSPQAETVQSASTTDTNLLPSAIRLAPKATTDLFASSNNYSKIVQYDGVTGALVGDFVASNCGGLYQQYFITFGPGGSLYSTSRAGTGSIKRFGGPGSTNPGGPYPAGAGAPSSTANCGSVNADFAMMQTGGELPWGLIFNGNFLYVTTSLNRVLQFNATTGAFVAIFVAAGSGGLSGAAGLEFGPDGNLYVASNLTGNVLKYNGTTGAFIGVVNSTTVTSPSDIHFIGNDILVSSISGSRIYRVNSLTGAVSDFVAPGFGGLNSAYGMGVSPVDGRLYVASHNNSQIIRYNLSDGSVGPAPQPFIQMPTTPQNSDPKDVVFGPGVAPTACAATTLSLSGTPNPVALGNSITVNFVVTQASGTIGGTAQVNEGSVSCSATIGANGTGSCTLTPTSGGIKTLNGQYVDSTTGLMCASAKAPQTVSVYSCGSTMSTSPSSSVLGQPVTLTANFTAQGGCTMSGTVTFKEGNTVIGTGVVNNGIATMTTSNLGVGNHSFTASGAVCGPQPMVTCPAAASVLAVSAPPSPVIVAPVAAPQEVPEADTLLLLGGGVAGLGTWLSWQWRKVRRK